jgi:hypothetical protein
MYARAKTNKEQLKFKPNTYYLYQVKGVAERFSRLAADDVCVD